MKSILITGASSGIGAATAMELSGPEQSLILVARSKEKLQVGRRPGPSQRRHG